MLTHSAVLPLEADPARPDHPGRRQCPCGRAPLQWVPPTRALAGGFHMGRMAASEGPRRAQEALDVTVREAATDEELYASAALRVRSFYVYPPERAFAGKLHQRVKTEEEFRLLKGVAEAARQRDQRPSPTAPGSDAESEEQKACLIAVSAPLRSRPADTEAGADDTGQLLVGGKEGGGRGEEALVGTLDLHAVRVLQGQPLIGGIDNAAYLGNVCVCGSVRRRGVGGQLIGAARELARHWGVQALYVHVLAANGVGRALYEAAGFQVEREERPDDAARRGHCLDGVSGGGRTLLLRDMLL